MKTKNAFFHVSFHNKHTQNKFCFILRVKIIGNLRFVRIWPRILFFDKTVSRGVVKVIFSADCNNHNDVWVFVYEQKRITITYE